ncbi:MAG: ketopantoate reductase family protein [Candidatus Limnocylindria bacterium]
MAGDRQALADNGQVGTSGQPLPRVAVYGAGALGCFFGARLARARAAEVQLIARGDHLAALRAGGLTLRAADGDYQVSLSATDDPVEVGEVDFVLFTVKAYDTEAAAQRLAPLLGPETAVISLQNGVDNEEKLAAAIGTDHVMGGAAYVSAAIEAPGVVRHAGGPGRMVFGELDGRATERGQRLLAACAEAQIPAELSTDIRAELWSKYSFILAQAGMTAAVRLPIGEIRRSPAAWEMFATIVEEVLRVGQAEGVRVGDDIVAGQLAFAESLQPGVYSSLHADLTAGRRIELAALHGDLLRRADKHALPVPACRAVYAILEPWALRAGDSPPPATG